MRFDQNWLAAPFQFRAHGAGTLAATFAVLTLTAGGCGGERQAAGSAARAPNEVTGKVAAVVGGLPSVIQLSPERPSTLPGTPPPVVMDQMGMSFSPRLLVAHPGQQVEFRNSDEVPHGVRVRSNEARSPLFNVSVDAGHPFWHRFEQAGAYSVSCDIHPGMSAFIFVTSAPYAAVTEQDGAFSFSGVPPGSYTLSVWNMDPARRLERRVEITAGRTELSLGSVP